MLITDFQQFKNIPKDVYDGSIHLPDSHLTSLKDFPKEVMGDVYIPNNRGLTSLEGAPQRIKGEFDVNGSSITSIEFAPRIMRAFSIRNTLVKDLHNIHKQIDHLTNFYTSGTKIESHILGLMMIKNLSYVHINIKGFDVGNILNKHLKTPDIHIRTLQCQEELIENGFEDLAQL